MYVYPPALRANQPPRFFNELVNLFEVWRVEPSPGTHGKMHARSTVLHGGVWGGRSPPPQGHVVKCVRVLPCYMGT